MVFNHVAGPAEREGERDMKKMIQLHLAVQNNNKDPRKNMESGLLLRGAVLPNKCRMNPSEN